MGSDQRFSLKWNNYQSHLVTAFESLLDQKDFIDVTLGVEGRKLPAHKMLLSACSPYFRDLLKGNPCQHPIIILRDICYDDLFSLLQFMYNGEVNVAQDQLNSFLKSAESLKIRGLTDNEGGGGGENSTPLGGVQTRETLSSPLNLQPPPPQAKKKRPLDPPPNITPTTSIPSPAPQPIKRPTLPTPAKQQHMEPVKQEVIELGDDQYDGEEQYPDQGGPHGGYEEHHDDIGGTMVPADESGMEEMQGDGNQGFWNYKDYESSNYGETGFKPKTGMFGCQLCEKRFESSASLGNHMKVHEGKTTCNLCGKVESTTSNLNRHMKTTHPEFIA